MFKIIAEPLIWWPVLFAGAADDGTIVENKIEMRFIILGEDEIDDFARQTDALLSGKAKPSSLNQDDIAPPSPSARSVPIIQRIARDWRSVAMENGEALPFNADNLQALLNVPNVLPAILRAYGACRSGRAEVREGN